MNSLVFVSYLLRFICLFTYLFTQSHEDNSMRAFKTMITTQSIAVSGNWEKQWICKSRYEMNTQIWVYTEYANHCEKWICTSRQEVFECPDRRVELVIVNRLIRRMRALVTGYFGLFHQPPPMSPALPQLADIPSSNHPPHAARRKWEDIISLHNINAESVSCTYL